VVGELETAFAEASGTAHCVAVSNGTTALQASLLAVGIRPGDEVITSPFTFIATVNSLLAVGAKVRFADIGDDFTLDPDSIADLITDRTTAVLPVHLFGLPADMPAIQALAQRHGLAVIEDAAQAHGATVGGRAVGGWGTTGCFSLYATKNISAGEGGLITTDDDSVAERLRALRNQGMVARYEYLGWGCNWRMTDLHAAIALPQVVRLGATNERRRANAARLTDGLRGVSGLRLPQVPEGRTHVWHQYTVEVLGGPAARAALSARLTAAGIGNAVFYPQALPDVPHLSAHPDVADDFAPRARIAAERVLSLPVGHHLDDAQIDRVATAVQEVLS
jgi:dTDP-4-amino-4,6-dideoxygalactose transaminase